MTPNPTPRIISLFPLPATVFFPKTYLPLHIFEPRYREMVEDALRESAEENRLIGMVLLKEDWQKDYYGNPPVHPIGCIGRMMHVQHLNDGRFNLVLYGLEKFRVQEPIFDRSYRRAWVEAIRPADETPASLPESLRTKLEASLQIYAQIRGWENHVRTVQALRLDDEPLVQLLSSELEMTPNEKQFLLESDDLVQQCGRLIDLLGFMTDERRSRTGSNRPSDAGP
ncbi:MAG: LON peptidase substrate-binding domain-containing protein [Nitrospirae bacterium]|nr:LON peptidase substrate-binding domain-containing protein [Nitrospirota bacterium]